MTCIKFFNIFFFIFLSLNAFAAGKKSKTTTYSFCQRELPNQKIIVTMETLSEKICLERGLIKAEQYTSLGWKCVGLNNEDFFSCESQKASNFAIFNGKKLDHLTFTNLAKHRSMVAYLAFGSKKICHEDKAELKLAGVKDANCHLVSK
jgi:hypothetical protein